MLTFLGYLSADLCVQWLPTRTVDGAARALARLLHALRPPARRNLEDNLARWMPHAPPAALRNWTRQAFEHFALSLTDFLRQSRPGRDETGQVEVRGRHHLEWARSTGRGVIVLSAHLGSWERGAAYLAARGLPLHVVARPHPSPWVESFFSQRRRARGIGTIPDRPVWIGAARALRGGKWIALMGDRPAARCRGSLCAWAAALARRSGALVLPAVMVRLSPDRYAACFNAPLSPVECVAGGYRRILERYLRLYPGQWLAFEPLPDGLG
jgi:KDO2-lipid IV(A) lauroyltransferase